MDKMNDELIKIVEDLYNNDIILNADGIFDKKAIKAWEKQSHLHQPSQKTIIPFTKDEVAHDSILKAAKILPFLLKRTKKKATTSSYGLKHYVERTISTQYNGSYISNGQLILAMLYLKYEYKLDEFGSWNCKFLADYVKNDYWDNNNMRPHHLLI